MTTKITANKFAEFITAKSERRRKSIVRNAMHSKQQCAPYYMAFQRPAKEFLLSGASDPKILTNAIEKLKNRIGTEWKNRDSRLTAQALQLLLTLSPKLVGLAPSLIQPHRTKANLHLPEIEVSVPPFLMIHGERNGKPLIGSMRIYIAKSSGYSLDPKAAELIATMQYMWLVQEADGDRFPDSSLCMVAECFQQRITPAPSNTERAQLLIQKSAIEFAKIWHQIEHDEAA